MNARLAPSMQRPRLGFLGLGWIGRQRMQSLAESGEADIVAIADAQASCAQSAAQGIAGVRIAGDLDGLLDTTLDGIVIATPSGAHAAQAIAALQHGVAVFCQKPLARTAAEAETVVEAARRADRLLGVDFSYRTVAGIPELRTLVRSGQLGDIYAVDLTFHNAYGPDKPWFYDLAQSGGGCVMDLGVHLIDLAAWIRGAGDADALDARLSAQGNPLPRPLDTLEDYATVQWRSRDGVATRMTCSWRLPAGCDAIIEAAFYGTRGGAAMRNVAGSFHDFNVERFEGTQRQLMAGPPDAWGGRMLRQWTRQLARNPGFDPDVRSVVDVARIVDRIYGR
jgi:predicted dehydrogenase